MVVYELVKFTKARTFMDCPAKTKVNKKIGLYTPIFNVI